MTFYLSIISVIFYCTRKSYENRNFKMIYLLIQGKKSIQLHRITFIHTTFIKNKKIEIFKRRKQRSQRCSIILVSLAEISPQP